ncbi:FliM/FliN family flagellar motor C-terminal domain-containing protein [Sphingomonas sp. Leaf33]|uniref:FliM/FliN family flagellar motor C-terminal domain-containing protein n=1 Tax=Sphingomonas sp. Leaf33 TaxID=1736215 RepID=UPI00138F6DA7|nr:FliM/FliN family flagellar motor switch protein [Sphingomonas sp. Leaf33]
MPADTVPPAALDALVAETVADWSARWFVGEAVRFAPLCREARTNLAWRALDVGLMLGTTGDTALKTGARMLGVAAEDRATVDRALLEEVAENCLVDLRARLARLAGVSPDAEWRPVVRAPGWCAAIGGPAAQIAIALTDAFFATLVARVLPSTPAIPLGLGGAALAAVEVEVSAAVGHADISVAELRGLEIGDVVVLGRPLAEPVPIAVDGHPLVRGTARIIAAEPPFLEIVEAATRA